MSPQLNPAISMRSLRYSRRRREAIPLFARGRIKKELEEEEEEEDEDDEEDIYLEEHPLQQGMAPDANNITS